MRTLRKALNLPVDTLPNHWPNEHASRTSQMFFTDSGYSSKANPQSGEAMQSFTASRNGNDASYSAALGFESSFRVKTSPISVEFNSQEQQQNSSKLYERSLKSSLDESETKRMLLLEKLREAHLAIQVHANGFFIYSKCYCSNFNFYFLHYIMPSWFLPRECKLHVPCTNQRSLQKKLLYLFSEIHIIRLLYE